ncbi:unnamed protein product [Eruca vesicaria subsp. sativa]|uniref:Uncharacterized protein n=1 Tax=Eruca vesicaria subsp. sativa TaxID=29727 RepID=A0ABC8LAX7_ERUVS|nr:unnamed protein product [Eruca vesicaria subsp. sativa]
MVMAYSFWPAPAPVPSICIITGAFHGGRDDSNPMREKERERGEETGRIEKRWSSAGQPLVV